MRRLLMLAALALPLTSGCAWMSTKSAILEAPQVKTLPPLGQKVQRTVDAANATLTVVYTFVRDGLKAQTLALKDADVILAKADEYSDEMDRAQKLIDAGGFDAAQAKAAATQMLIKLLHDQAMAAARQRSELDLEPALQLLGA